MAKRRNDTKPAPGRAMGQAKTSKAPRTTKKAKKSTSSKRTKIAVDVDNSSKYRKKTAVVGRGKKGASKKATVKRITKIRSAAARKGWETRRENARVAEEKRVRRSEASKAAWAKRKRDVQLTERRKLLDIRDLRQIADDRIKKLESNERDLREKRFKELHKLKTAELRKLSKKQLLEAMPDVIRTTIGSKKTKAALFDLLQAYEGFVIRSFLVGMEKTSEMAGDVMRKFVDTKVYGTELEFLQQLDTTRQILMHTGNWEEAPDSLLFTKLKAAYGTPQFEAVVTVLSNETGYSERYLYSLFHSPDASVFA